MQDQEDEACWPGAQGKLEENAPWPASDSVAESAVGPWPGAWLPPGSAALRTLAVARGTTKSSPMPFQRAKKASLGSNTSR